MSYEGYCSDDGFTLPSSKEQSVYDENKDSATYSKDEVNEEVFKSGNPKGRKQTSTEMPRNVFKNLFLLFTLNLRKKDSSSSLERKE